MNNEYEIMALLERGTGDNLEEWAETTLVEAQDLDKAGRMAKVFAREMAREHNARVVDAFAIDDNGNASD